MEMCWRESNFERLYICEYNMSLGHYLKIEKVSLLASNQLVHGMGSSLYRLIV
jgi:hypothetical protein